MTGGTTQEKLTTFLAEVPNERLDKPFNNQNIRGVARRFASARD